MRSWSPAALALAGVTLVPLSLNLACGEDRPPIRTAEDERAEASAREAAAPPAPVKLGFTPIWDLTYRAEERAQIAAIAPTPDGGLMLGGVSRGALHFFDQTIKPKGEDDILVMKTDARGVPAWGKSFGAEALQQLTGLVVTPDGDALLAGVFTHGFSLGETRLISRGHLDAFIARISPEGDVRWSKQLGGPGADTIESLTLDRAGDLWVTGSLRTTLQLSDDVTLTARGEQDAFIARFSQAGELRWSQQLGVDGFHKGHQIITAPDGDLIVAGLSAGALELGAQRLESGSLEDIFLARLSPAGVPRWIRAIGHAGDRERLHAIACSEPDVIVLTGRRGRALELDATELKRVRRGRPFVASFTGDGAARWVTDADARYDELNDRGLALFRDGDLLLLGTAERRKRSNRNAPGVYDEILLQRVARDDGERSDPYLLATTAWGRGTALYISPQDDIVVAGNSVHEISDPGRPRLRSVEHIILRGLTYELGRPASPAP